VILDGILMLAVYGMIWGLRPRPVPASYCDVGCFSLIKPNQWTL